MAYIAAYSALFAKPLLNQLIAVIQRDQAGAIAIVNSMLNPIKEFHKGPGMRTAFPWLMLTVDGMAFDEEVPSYPSSGPRRWEARVSLSLDVGQFDQEIAQDNAQDYARVLDMIVSSADLNGTGPYSSWVTALPITHETVPSGITSPNAPGSFKEVFIASQHYSLTSRPDIEAPVVTVTTLMIFRFQEQ
jgi:hypothetical protein